MTSSSQKPSTESKWSDIPVGSWEELLRELHSAPVIPTQERQGGHRRSPYVFRGMSDASWPLQTTLERLGSPAEWVEKPLIRAFEKYAPGNLVARSSDWQNLAVAQHNGLPTRLLDWTVSPLIAAHFATAEAQFNDVDGVIWCVHVDTVRENLLPSLLKDRLVEAQAFVYNVRMLAEDFPSLDAFDATGGKVGEDVLIFLEPPSIDQRIHNQFGILSAMNGSSKSHDDFLHGCYESRPDLVKRIVVRSEAKSEIRDMLDQNNITERMLFPGLPGLCSWLKRYYGPA